MPLHHFRAKKPQNNRGKNESYIYRVFTYLQRGTVNH